MAFKLHVGVLGRSNIARQTRNTTHGTPKNSLIYSNNKLITFYYIILTKTKYQEHYLLFTHFRRQNFERLTQFELGQIHSWINIKNRAHVMSVLMLSRNIRILKLM